MSTSTKPSKLSKTYRKWRGASYEKDLKAKALRYIKSIDGVWAYKTSDRWIAGIPDILGIANGLGFAIECKTKTVLSDIQVATIKTIRHAGGMARVCRSMEDVRNFMEEVMKT